MSLINPNNPNPDVRDIRNGVCELCDIYLNYKEVLQMTPKDTCIMCSNCRAKQPIIYCVEIENTNPESTTPVLFGSPKDSKEYDECINLNGLIAWGHDIEKEN